MKLNSLHVLKFPNRGDKLNKEDPGRDCVSTGAQQYRAWGSSRDARLPWGQSASFGDQRGRRLSSVKSESRLAGMTNRLSVYSADMPRNGPIEGSLRRLPVMEALELLMMDSEYHKLPILRAECCIGPNAAIATVKVDYSKISECWRCTPKLRDTCPSPGRTAL